MSKYELVGNITNIKTGKLDANASSVDGKYLFFTCSKTPLHISTYSYDCECVLIAGNGDLNVKYYYGKFDAYQRTYIVESLDKSIWSTRFLYYFFEGKINHLRNQSIGGVIKYIKMGDLTSLKIPIHSMYIQEQIAAELDTLNDIIAKKREQLDQLDTLAQATFYDMFGDPVDNEKGWDMKRLEDICTKITDGTHASPQFINEGVPFLFVSNIQDYEINYDTQKYISLEEYEYLTRNTKIEKGDLLYTSVGSYGNPAIVRTSQKFSFQRHIAHLKPVHELVNVVFLHLLMRLDYVKNQANRLAIGVAQKTLNLSAIKKITIPLPPLPLQNQFAERIEAIEKQKELINKSIVETQLLFDYTMDKYFN